MKYAELRGNLTKKETAKRLNIEEKTYANYENNVTEPKIATLIKIADYYQVSLDYLCDRPFNNGIGYIPEDRKDLVKEIIEMSADEVKQLKTYIRGYKYGKGESKEFKVFED